MVRFLFTLFISFGVFAGSIYAATTPSQIVLNEPVPSARQSDPILRLSVRDIEKLSGKKMTFGEKVRFNIAKAAHKLLPRFEEGEPTEKQLKQGRLSMIFGLGGAFLFMAAFIVPPVVFLSLPLGIAALIIGLKSAKGNGNTQAIIGIVAGSTVILVWLLMIIAIAAIISSGGIWG
jgi:hypothetical protein